MATLRLQGRHSIRLETEAADDLVVAVCEEPWCLWRESYDTYGDAICYAADHADDPGESPDAARRARGNAGRFD